MCRSTSGRGGGFFFIDEVNTVGYTPPPVIPPPPPLRSTGCACFPTSGLLLSDRFDNTRSLHPPAPRSLDVGEFLLSNRLEYNRSFARR
jgi:hypothetical protein